MTSCRPSHRRRYQGSASSSRRIPPAWRRSSIVSNSGTTRSGRSAPDSFCSSSTISTSDGRVAIEITYAPSDSAGSFAAVRNVSSTSRTSADAARSAGISGRRPCSSRSRNAWRSASLHSSYAPSPSSRVMVVIISSCRVACCRTSRRTRVAPNAATRRSRSHNRPPAMTLSPVSTSDRWHRRSGSAMSSACSMTGTGAMEVPASHASIVRSVADSRVRSSRSSSRYGSSASPTRARSSSLASVIDSS